MRTHVYLMHVINQSGAEESSSSTVAFLQDYVCVTCDRKFSNSDALYQHQRARHSVGIRDNSLKESDSMAVQSANSVEKLEYSVVCAICDYAFESVVHLEEHMRQGLIPITPVAFNVCKNCGRNFADRRAMEQHVKFCVN